MQRLMPGTPIHRVVTGHDAGGKSIVVSDGPPPTVVEMEAVPGMIFHEIWQTHGTPPRVDSGADPTGGPVLHHAPPNGTRVRFVDLPPDASYLDGADARMKALFEEVRDERGLTSTAESPHPMMHRSEAIDYGVVIEGEVTLVLDDSEVSLRPGSVVVQRGTNHAWANRSEKVCRMLFVQLDGRYEASLAATLARR